MDDLRSNIGLFNTLRPKQSGRHFADATFKRIFFNENLRISIKSSLFIPKGSINNIPALVQIMAWRRPGDKPLSEPMLIRLPTHIWVTLPQWVKVNKTFSIYMRLWQNMYALFCLLRTSNSGTHTSLRLVVLSSTLYIEYFPSLSCTRYILLYLAEYKAAKLQCTCQIPMWLKKLTYNLQEPKCLCWRKWRAKAMYPLSRRFQDKYTLSSNRKNIPNFKKSKSRFSWIWQYCWMFAFCVYCHN